jgi:hypothetical protein
MGETPVRVINENKKNKKSSYQLGWNWENFILSVCLYPLGSLALNLKP